MCRARPQTATAHNRANWLARADRYEEEADAAEAASGWFGDGWAVWFTEWLWGLLDSLGIFSLGWFDGLLPVGGPFGGGVDSPPDESASFVEPATAEAAQNADAAFEGTGAADSDPDALFPVRCDFDLNAAATSELTKTFRTLGRRGCSGRSACRCCGCHGCGARTGGGGGGRGTVRARDDVGRR